MRTVSENLKKNSVKRQRKSNETITVFIYQLVLANISVLYIYCNTHVTTVYIFYVNTCKHMYSPINPNCHDQIVRHGLSTRLKHGVVVG